MSKKKIVFLVDHKVRDLMGVSLICHHLEKRGVKVRIEPLQSWRSCLGAWKPDMIIFNHLLHSHITKFTQELNSYGVLVGCLLSEGMCITDAERMYLSTKRHSNVHCDLFLAWNEKHRVQLIKEEFCSPPNNVVTIGVPRFDFYKTPFSEIYLNKKSNLPRILINTTFSIAHFKNRTAKERLLVQSALGPETDNGKNYERLIESHYKSREMVLLYLNKIVCDFDCELTIRPHPREEVDFYSEWINSLDPNLKQKVKISKNLSVASDILNHDLILNCEDCTTALEAWIAGKPTITLALSKDPAFFTDLYRESSPVVEVADESIFAIKNALKSCSQDQYASLRQEILSDLLYKSDGRCSFRAAEAILDLLASKKEAPRIPFKFDIVRRAIKLRLLSLIDQPGHATPKQILYDILRISSHEKSSIRDRSYFKAIKPSDVRSAMGLIKNVKS